MNAKEEFWRTNLLHATVTKHGREFNIFHNRHDKQLYVLETGARRTIGRREFRRWIKQIGGKCMPMLKTGQFINKTTGKLDAVWGISPND